MSPTDTKVDHPLAKMLATVHSLVTKDETGEIQRSQGTDIPPSGFHRTVVVAVIIPEHRAIAIMTVHVLGVPLRIGTKELQFESDPRSKPFTKTDSPVRRDSSFELTVLGIVAPESVGTASGVDKPVLAERVSHNPAGVQQGVPLRKDPGTRLRHDCVTVDLAVIFVHLVNLTPSRRGGQEGQGDNSQYPAYQIESFHNAGDIFLFICSFILHSTRR